MVGPHYDDAVYSVAEHMLGWMEDGHEVTVVVVFGNDNAGAKERRLRREHTLAMMRLGAKTIVLNYTDDAHFDNMKRWDAISEVLMPALRPFDVVAWPVGMHHPDHKVIRRIRSERSNDSDQRLWLYDELPYYVLYPEEALKPALHRLPSRSYLAQKRVLVVSCYASQYGELEERSVFAPERVWRWY